MKKLLSIFLFSFLLSNCSSIAVIGGSSLSSSYIVSDIKTLFDVVSLVETGKTTNDHVLSAVVDKDCNLFGILCCHSYENLHKDPLLFRFCGFLFPVIYR